MMSSPKAKYGLAGLLGVLLGGACYLMSKRKQCGGGEDAPACQCAEGCKCDPCVCNPCECGKEQEMKDLNVD